MRRRIETDLAWRGGGGGGGGGTPLNSQDVQELADKALATLSCHLWFLAPNTVLFTFASEKLEDEDDAIEEEEEGLDEMVSDELDDSEDER